MFGLPGCEDKKHIILKQYKHLIPKLLKHMQDNKMFEISSIEASKIMEIKPMFAYILLNYFKIFHKNKNRALFHKKKGSKYFKLNNESNWREFYGI